MTIDVQFQQNYDIESVESEWQGLESRVRPSFFLTWAWIGCWLVQTGVRPILVRASRSAETIALGFLTPHERRRHALSVRQLRLNETGIGDHDRLTIEHNGFLAVPDAPDKLLRHVFSMMQQSPALGDWDEIVLGGVPSSMVAAAEAAGLVIETDNTSADYRVNLSALLHDDVSWLSRQSSNLRAQLRQARKTAERHGSLSLTVARTTEEALSFFEAMRVLHEKYWQSRGQSGAFATEFARRFHRALISGHTDDGQVELLKLSAGQQQLGYLYNFVSFGTVYNYQSGFSYSGDNRDRPGLLAHAMAIERAMSQGCGAYDFLAGDASYKARFGENSGSLIWCRAQRDRPTIVVERMARRGKQIAGRLLGRR